MDINNLFNKGDDLPFAYFNPTSEGKVTWNCNYDQDGKVTSVFMYSGEGKPERQVTYLTLEQARETRNTLVEHGWKETQLPKINFKTPDGDRDLTKKERKLMDRAIARKIKKERKILEGGK